MQFQEVVRRRRMVRAFRPEPVPEATLLRLVATARRGPSAGNTRGVSFVLVTDPEIRQSIADAAGESWYVDHGHRPFISQAPAQVVVCTSEQAYRERYREPDKQKPTGLDRAWPVPYWYTDAGAALMLLLLAAVDEGLDAAFVGVRDPDNLRRLLGVPADVLPIGVVLLGHGAQDKPSRSLQRGRKTLAEVLHRERW